MEIIRQFVVSDPLNPTGYIMLVQVKNGKFFRLSFQDGYSDLMPISNDDAFALINS